MSLPPVLKVIPESPDALIFPEVAVKLSAPVVRVKPFEAVNKPLEVIVPPAVVRILPVVERLPFSLIVRVGVPLVWTSSAF